MLGATPSFASCPACQKPVEPDWAFCAQCGADVRLTPSALKRAPRSCFYGRHQFFGFGDFCVACGSSRGQLASRRRFGMYFTLGIPLFFALAFTLAGFWVKHMTVVLPPNASPGAKVVYDSFNDGLAIGCWATAVAVLGSGIHLTWGTPWWRQSIDTPFSDQI